MLDCSIASGEFTPSGFQIFRKDQNCHGGGVAIAVNKNIEATEIPMQLPETEALLVELKIVNSKLLILVFYRPPSSNDPHLIPDLLELVTGIANSRKTRLIVCGDLNMPSINWAEYTVPTGDVPQALLDSVADLNLTKHIHEATYVKGNILDGVFSNVHCIKSIIVHKPLLSDHYIIDIETHLNVKDDERTERKI
ncbi:uncharacterized protein [Watersipora subatra]|uniref:uncharacterized protein n=1 Tax=Watersipora subatra TaxID=2589382 RepID=UPI00355AD611